MATVQIVWVTKIIAESVFSEDETWHVNILQTSQLTQLIQWPVLQEIRIGKMKCQAVVPDVLHWKWDGKTAHKYAT